MVAAVPMAWMDQIADASVALLQPRLAIAGPVLRFGSSLEPQCLCDFRLARIGHG
jgi:hypothetical protein